MKTAIILGSARSDGNTRRLCENLNGAIDAKIIDLNNYSFSHFDYKYSNKADDYYELITYLIDNYDAYVFASPIYWYSMSSIMKCFFDRISDLLFHHNNLARKLKNKKMYVLSCGSDDEMYDCFIQPFKLSSEYLKMDFMAHCHGWLNSDTISEEVKDRIELFANQLK